jgi:pSer/pThr/pTyr-binding forkhead associated (FHA) protein
MTICPFCHFQNEDGALFCEQCKSDLSGVQPSAPAAPAAPLHAEPVAVEPVAVEPIPVEPVPVMPLSVDPIPVMEIQATPVEPVAVMPAEPMPVEPMPVEPVAVMPVEPMPVEPVAPAPPPPAPPEPVAQTPAPVQPAPEPPPVIPAPVPAAPAPAAPAPAAADAVLPAGAEPKLVVIRGQRRNAEYPLFEGPNFIGRSDDKPVDVDLEDQEPADRVWCSRQHAVIFFEGGALTLEDLNSSNGTFLNRNRVYPGAKQSLKPSDVIQIGNVQLKVVV